MERIVLEVDDAVGKVYRNFSDEGKMRFKETVSLMLKKAVNEFSINSYKAELDELGREAVANGLTQEELDQLLADD